MKICQLCAVDFTLCTFLLPLIDTQIKAGHEVISVCSDGEYAQNMIDSGYKIETITIERSFNIVNHFKSTLKIYKFLRSNSFDVLHVHTPVAAMLGRLAAFFARVPVVIYTAHGFYFHENMKPLQKFFYISLEYFFGLMTDVIFTQSEEDARDAKRYSIGPSKGIYAIGNGVDIKRFNPAIDYSSEDLRQQLGIPADAFVVGVICRLVKEKGIEEFLSAAKKIHHINKKCYFLIVGEKQSHDHADGVDQFINSAKQVLGNNLILTGYRTDIPNLLNIMNLYVLPSWREGMPRSIIEAMMMNLPILATNIRGSREEVIHNVTGLIVPVRSPIELFKGIQKFINNPDLAKIMGERGRQRALEIYDESKVLNLQMRILNKHIR